MDDPGRLSGFVARASAGRRLVSVCEERGIEFEELRPEILDLSRSVKFELFFSILSDYLGRDVQDVVASTYVPISLNQNHQALAALSFQHSVFTTNFDENIEACGGSVHHLHGRASIASSLVVTTDRLADRGRKELVDFEDQIRKSGKLVCVGYSGWGDVDIYPILTELATGPTKRRILWCDRPGFEPPVDATVYTHDLLSRDNLLTAWSGLSAVTPASPSSSARSLIGTPLGNLARTRSTGDILRALASVAHEAGHGVLGLSSYELTERTLGSGTVSEYEWGVAYERADRRLEAAEHLKKAAEQAEGLARLGHLAGAAFCFCAAGRLNEAKQIYDETRNSPLLKRGADYSHLDNLLRGRAGLYAKLAAQIGNANQRQRLLESAGAFDDLRFLRDASDPEHKRPGRFELLLDIGELELEILAGRTATPELNRKLQDLWQRGRGLQDLGIEAKVGRLAAAIRRQTGRRLMWATVQSIRSKGASRRDLWKLTIAFAATFLPFVPDHWFILNPREALSGLLSRKHTDPAKAG